MKRFKSLAAIFVLAVLFVPSFNAFAANPYGINYEGGEPLSENNVQIAPEMINGTTRIIGNSGRTELNLPTKWEKGYYYKSGNNCIGDDYYYYLFSKNDVYNPGLLDYTFYYSDYIIEVRIKNVLVDDINNILTNDQRIGIFVGKTFPNPQLVSQLYTDASCTNTIEDFYLPNAFDNVYVYVEPVFKIYKKDTMEEFYSDELFLRINDIDASQAYKILNPGNELSRENMFAKSADVLQPTGTDLKNMYVSSGNYIYSQHHFNISTYNSDVYAKIDRFAQKNGLDIVFGYGMNAGSPIYFHAKTYNVKYLTDQYGEIAGIADEQIVSGNYPSSTTTKPSSGYELKYWIADKDVTLSDGTVIKAGQKILPSELTKVIVHSDLTFTAIHGLPEEDPEPIIPAPNSGAFTSETNASQVIFPIAGTLLGALLISPTYYFGRKKSIKFN